jgi:hypothetical protein
MAATETPTALGPCPTDEDLAAFLDGMLPEAERSRVIAHLADCRKCYRIFAESVHFLEGTEATGEEEAIVQFPFAEPKEQKRERKDRRSAIRWWVTAAAAAVLVVAVGYGGYRAFFAPPQMDTSKLVSMLPATPDPKLLYRFNRYRGLGGQVQDLITDRPSFMIGVLTIDLRRAPATQAPTETTAGILDQISRELSSSGFSPELAKRYQEDANRAKDSISFVRRLEVDLPRWEEELDQALLSPEFLAYGKWAETGRLAARTGTPDFFKSRDNRRLLSQAIAAKEQAYRPSNDDDVDAGAEREAAALAILRRIAATWDRGDLPQSYSKLADDFQRLIELYDN